MIKAIVTGHSRGLGAAIAGQLLDREIAVLGLSRQGNSTLAGRAGFAERALDLADSTALERWCDSGALEAFVSDARTLLLVNNAGLLGPVGPLPTQAPTVIASAIACNVTAALILSAAAARAVDATGATGARELRILHISSGAGRNPILGWSVYGAGKAALDHHARVVAAEAEAHLKICSLAPGVIDTDMQAEIRATPQERFPLRSRFEALKSNGGLSTPEACAAGIVTHLLAADFGNPPVADLRDMQKASQ